MSSDEQKLVAAKNELSEKLLGHFGLASGGPVHGVGSSKKDNCVNVYISREPSKDEKPSFPEEYNGVKVRYIVSPPARLA